MGLFRAGVRQQCDNRSKVREAHARFEAGKGSCEPRNRGRWLKSGKTRKWIVPWSQLCLHLDFCPVRSALDFRLQDCEAVEDFPTYRCYKKLLMFFQGPTVCFFRYREGHWHLKL